MTDVKALAAPRLQNRIPRPTDDPRAPAFTSPPGVISLDVRARTTDRGHSCPTPLRGLGSTCTKIQPIDGLGVGCARVGKGA